MENVSLKYIEVAKEKTGLSYYAIAKEIGVNPQQINALKHRNIELKDDALILLAQFAQKPSHKILAEKHMKAAKGPAEKAFWRAISSSTELLERSKDYILCSIQPEIDHVK